MKSRRDLGHSLMGSVLRPLLPYQNMRSFVSGERALQKKSNALSAGSLSEKLDELLEQWPLEFALRQDEKSRIPKTGPLIFVTNKPVSSAELWLLFRLLKQVRPDVKLHASSQLISYQSLREGILESASVRLPSDQASMSVEAHLLRGGAVIVAPARRWSEADGHGFLDGRWQTDFLTWSDYAQAPVVPLFFDTTAVLLAYSQFFALKPITKNPLFKALPSFRKTLVVRVGAAIDASVHKSWTLSASAKARLFRKELYRLGRNKKSLLSVPEVIAEPQNPNTLQAELDRCRLLGQTPDGMEILLYRYSEGSKVLDEIGRLREQAFRLIGEGTGQEIDTDEYDHYYDHILLWNSKALQIAGAYRLQPAAASLTTKSRKAIYTQTLFDFTAESVGVLRQGLELGRSFVHPDYWGSKSLDYLWVGIAAYLKNQPRFRYLFGAVSISNAFSKEAKDVLVYYYSRYYGAREPIVECQQPYRLSADTRQKYEGMFLDLDAKDGFVILKQFLGQLGFSVPVLYKQYTSLCELGAVQFHGFNIDAKFSDCIDGLVVVDVTRLMPNKAKRYGLLDYQPDLLSVEV